jgi:hypothetical protein
MKIENVVCDSCRKETVDVYAENGWIHICSVAGNNLISSVTRGRDAEGCAKTDCHQEFREAHLCGLDCLIAFIFVRDKKVIK